MNTKHTPGPWRVEGATVKAVSHGRGFKVARADATGYTREGNEANAAFIVRACNAHDVLIKAVHDIAFGLQTAPEMRDAARNAIAKATGP